MVFDLIRAIPRKVFSPMAMALKDLLSVKSSQMIKPEWSTVAINATNDLINGKMRITVIEKNEPIEIIY